MTGAEQVLIEDWCQQFPSHSRRQPRVRPGRRPLRERRRGRELRLRRLRPDGQPTQPVRRPAGRRRRDARAADRRGRRAARAGPAHRRATRSGSTGRVLRVDPDTGAGCPDNPLAASADANARRIVAYGLRNPFRFALRPGTTDVWVGDVGWRHSEEIDRIPNPAGARPELRLALLRGRRAGWPSYDGANLNICENLYAQPGAVTAPVFTYAHPAKVVPASPARRAARPSPASRSPAPRPYPAAYDGALFFADYSRRCIWVMKRGAGGLPSPTAVSTFVAAAANPVDLQIGPERRPLLRRPRRRHHPPRPVRREVTAPARSEAAPTPVIVGLGDSYSSGEANPRYDAGTDLRADRCHRSFLSWQRLVGVSSADQFACSGARLRNLTSGQHAVAPDNVGQLERLRGRATSKHIDWVALTIGGNDLGFARILRDCLDPRTTCLPQSAQLQRRQLDALEPHLVSAYRSAGIAAGGARVAVVGYPYLFPNVAVEIHGLRGDVARREGPHPACAGSRRGDAEAGSRRGGRDLRQHPRRAAGPGAVHGALVDVPDPRRGRRQGRRSAAGAPDRLRAGGDRAEGRRGAASSADGLRLRLVEAAPRRDPRRHPAGRPDGPPPGGRELRRCTGGCGTSTWRSRRSSTRRRGRSRTCASTTRRHFSADVDQSGSAAVGADRVWYSPAGASIRKVASCNFRYGCRAPAGSVPTRLATVRLLGARGAPRIRPRRFVREQTSGTDLEFLAVRWAHWGATKAIGSGRMARAGGRRVRVGTPPCRSQPPR